MPDELEQMRTVGRDDFLVEHLARQMLDVAQKHHDYTDLRRAKSGRGYTFDVRINVDGQPSGHIARVTVELESYGA